MIKKIKKLYWRYMLACSPTGINPDKIVCISENRKQQLMFECFQSIIIGKKVYNKWALKLDGWKVPDSYEDCIFKDWGHFYSGVSNNKLLKLEVYKKEVLKLPDNSNLYDLG